MLFFFNDTATTEIYTLSLHDALPISPDKEHRVPERGPHRVPYVPAQLYREAPDHQKPEHHDQRQVEDRKSTRLNSSHANISYAVFCLQKKRHAERLNANNKRISAPPT